MSTVEILEKVAVAASAARAKNIDTAAAFVRYQWGLVDLACRMTSIEKVRLEVVKGGYSIGSVPFRRNVSECRRELAAPGLPVSYDTNEITPAATAAAATIKPTDLGAAAPASEAMPVEAAPGEVIADSVTDHKGPGGEVMQESGGSVEHQPSALSHATGLEKARDTAARYSGASFFSRSKTK